MRRALGSLAFAAAIQTICATAVAQTGAAETNRASSAPASASSNPGSAGPTTTTEPTTAAACVDSTVRDELNARRAYRGVEERLIRKTARHELSMLGGLYAADLLSSSYSIGGSYTYHVSEEIALEATFGHSRATSEIVHIIENDRGTTLIRIDAPVFAYTAQIVWTLAYGKLRWFGSGIGRFDFNIALGGGITDNTTARGATFVGGFGLKFFANEWFAVRVDVRDHVLVQELLGATTIVNNLVATLGFSLFVPFES